MGNKKSKNNNNLEEQNDKKIFLSKQQQKEFLGALEKGDDVKNTALTVSCQYERIEIVKLLLELGADVNKTDNDGNSSLMMASYNGNIEIVKLLLDAGANVNHTDKNGNSALSVAVQYRQFEIFELLIDSGVDLEKCGGETLIRASEQNYMFITERLIELKVNLNFVDSSDGYCALHYACDYNNFKMVQLLINNGADENIKNINGKTPIELTKSDEIKEFIMNSNSSNYVLK